MCFHQFAKVSQNNVGGTSGALYGILMGSAAQYLRSATSMDWAAMFKTSLDKLLFYSKAKIGDRTMVRLLYIKSLINLYFTISESK